MRIMKKTTTILISILLLVVASLVSLFQFAKIPNSHLNGFKRHFFANITLKTESKTTEPLQEICGFSKDKIYFTVPNPQWVIAISTNLDKQDTITFGQLPKGKLGAYWTRVDSPSILLFINNLPGIIRGTLNKGGLDIFKLKNPVYTRAVYLPINKVIIRAMSFDNSKQVFQKFDLTNGKEMQHAEIIQDQKYAGFSNDGHLLFDSMSKHIFYVENYRNYFYCLDTNLNLVYKAHTIDTTYSNPTIISKVNFDGTERFVPATARSLINVECQAENGYLYIQSSLMADNETVLDHNGKSIVDVYKQNDGKYIGSFYIPYLKRKKLKTFAIKNNILVALYENFVVTYSLPLELLN
jgi:hypothetical protein